jgi:hypothetical protein
MQALAMGGKPAFLVCQSSSCGKIALAILPGETVFATLLDAPFLVIIQRVVGTTLTIELAF